MKFSRIATFFSLLTISALAQSNPVACFNSNMGHFCIELFEGHTPVTTANFVNYIDSGAYTNGIFHRNRPGFVIQGGGFRIVSGADGSTLVPVTTFAPITNEYKLSNIRGTVAMAKLDDNPDSATSQWFVNMNDNSANLNYQNGGFTVFGRVIFDGMTVFDAIEQLPVFKLNNSMTHAPLIGYDGTHLLSGNFVRIEQVTVTDTAGIFDEGILSISVDIGSDAPLDVKFQLIGTDPEYVFELDATSVQPLATKPATIATFSATTGELYIPSVMLDATTTVRKVTLQLTDPETYQFTLKSFE
ncbi:MAG: peptidylprolyl isomerase [Nitrosomonas sp.]|nr:MAG: peptidylprolyl isomerase [Nitrosomonas sp.]